MTDLSRPALPSARIETTDHSAATSSQPSGSTKLPVWAFLRCVRRRWKPAIGFGLLAAAAVGAAIWFFLPPPLPTASAKLYAPQKPLTALGGEHPDPPIDRATQVELIKSRLVLNAAIRPQEISSLSVLQIQRDPLDFLATKLKVDFVGPEILRISLSLDNAEQARILVDAIKDSYLRDFINRSLADRSDRIKRLNEMASSQEESLKRKRNTIRELGKDGPGGETDRQALYKQLLTDQMQAARTQLVKTEVDLRTARSREILAGSDGQAEILPAVLEQLVDQDRRVVESLERLKKAESAFELFRAAAADPKSPTVLKEESKLETLRLEHKELRERVRREIRDNAKNQSKSDRERVAGTIKQEIFLLEQQIQLLTAEIERYGKSLNGFREHGQDLEPIRFEIKQNEELLSRVRNMLMTLSMEQDTPPRVVELEKAVITRVDPEKRKMMIAVGGSIAAFLLIAALFGFLEFRKRRVSSPDAVTRALGVRVLGSVPVHSSKSLRWRTEGGVIGESEKTEAIAWARTMLLYGEGLSSHRVFLVTSPVSGEGKSTLTTELAISVALAGRRTLVIDGDLRNPSMHKRLGLMPGPGLCEVLRGEASIFDVMQSTTIPGLMLIQAGRWTQDTAEAFHNHRIANLLATCREQFEFVIADSSPTLLLADPMILARHTDGVILSLLEGVSCLPQAAEACERFSSIGVRVFGAVVSGTQSSSRDTAKYYDPTYTGLVKA